MRLRWGWLIVLAAIELAWIRGALAVPDLSGQDGLVAGIIAAADQYISVTTLGAFAVALAGTILLIFSRRWRLIAGILGDQEHYRWSHWLAWHGAAFLGFLAVSWPALGPDPDVSSLSAAWLIGWLAIGSAIPVSLLLSAAPGAAWLRLARQEKSSVIIAAVAGVAALAGGHLVQGLWLPLAKLTLWCTYGLLSVVYANVYVDPGTALLGVDAFLVQIAPACSGYEGMALIAVFVTLYLGLFRANLKFPDALLLFPIGLVVIWLTNVLRIAALVAIGTSVSPEIALNGFHSQAGWIGFSIVSLGMLGLSHRYFLLAPANDVPLPTVTNSALAPALISPLLVLLAASMLIAALSGGFPTLYPLGVLVTAGTLWHFRKHYTGLTGAVSWQAVAIGCVIFVAWWQLVPGDDGAQLARGLAALPGWMSVTWVTFRIIGSVVTVPLVEELAFRGYLIRKLVSSDFENVPPGTFTWLSFTASSLLFGLLHDSWLAGTVAGAGFALALYHRGRVSDAVVAHMTSNGLVAAAVLLGGKWALWT